MPLQGWGGCQEHGRVVCGSMCTGQGCPGDLAPNHLHEDHQYQCLETGTRQHPAACTSDRLDCTHWDQREDGPSALVVLEPHSVSKGL